MPHNLATKAAPYVPATARWAWRYRGPQGAFEGTVSAIDPRDATSRALTSTTQDGRLFGDAHRVPMDVLYAAPANGASTFRFDDLAFTFEVSRQAGSE